jgi:hypothetical protein
VRRTVESNAFPEDHSLSLVLLVDGNLDHVSLNGPSVSLEEGGEVVVVDVQRSLDKVLLNLASDHADLESDSITHSLLETSAVGDKVGVQVIGLVSGPELAVGSRLDQLVENAKLADGGGEVVGGGVGIEDVGREKVKAEAEVRAGEDEESLNEDVGDSLITGKVGVELVAMMCGNVSEIASKAPSEK